MIDELPLQESFKFFCHNGAIFSEEDIRGTILGHDIFMFLD